jgi:hypothetical protein
MWNCKLVKILLIGTLLYADISLSKAEEFIENEARNKFVIEDTKQKWLNFDDSFCSMDQNIWDNVLISEQELVQIIRDRIGQYTTNSTIVATKKYEYKTELQQNLKYKANLELLVSLDPATKNYVLKKDGIRILRYLNFNIIPASMRNVWAKKIGLPYVEHETNMLTLCGNDYSLDVLQHAIIFAVFWGEDITDRDTLENIRKFLSFVAGLAIENAKLSDLNFGDRTDLDMSQMYIDALNLTKITDDIRKKLHISETHICKTDDLKECIITKKTDLYMITSMQRPQPLPQPFSMLQSLGIKGPALALITLLGIPDFQITNFGQRSPYLARIMYYVIWPEETKIFMMKCGHLNGDIHEITGISCDSKGHTQYKGRYISKNGSNIQEDQSDQSPKNGCVLNQICCYEFDDWRATPGLLSLRRLLPDVSSSSAAAQDEKNDDSD